MNDYERVRYIRKELLNDMSQQEFSNKIDISRSNLGNIETGKVKLTERVVISICKAFKISYPWLTKGIGDPIISTPENIFDEIRREYDLTDDDIFILKEYSSLEKAQRKRLKAYIHSLIEAEKKEEG